MEATQQYLVVKSGVVLHRIPAHSIWHARQIVLERWPEQGLNVKPSKSRYGYNKQKRKK